MNNSFIWTEALGCGEILTPMLNSFVHHMDHEIHVFIYETDLIFIPDNSKIIPVILNEDPNSSTIDITADQMKKAYEKGHDGTALLWSMIISKRQEEFLIHLDADTVFLGDVVSPILERLSEGYGIVGTRRPYRLSAANINKINKILLYFRKDAVNTHCFGFDKTKIGIKKRNLRKSINGQGKNRIHQRIFPIIDFFDRITFSIAQNSQIFYLDSNMQNKHGSHNRDGQIESLMISFAAVGSGCSFYKNPNVKTSPTYKEFALASYSLYSAELLGKKIQHPTLDSPFLKEKLARLNLQNWSLD